MNNGNIDTYLNKKLEKKTIRLIYDNNKITPEISHKYKFLFDYLLYNIYTTYLGVDVMSIDNNKKKHFNWCWSQFFKKYNNGFKFLNNENTKNNVFSYFETSFYLAIDEDSNREDETKIFNKISSSIESIFILNTYKTKYYIDELLNVHESIKIG